MSLIFKKSNHITYFLKIRGSVLRKSGEDQECSTESRLGEEKSGFPINEVRKGGFPNAMGTRKGDVND